MDLRADTVFEGDLYPIEHKAKGLVMSERDQKRLSAVAERRGSDVHEHRGDACAANRMLQAVAAMQGN